MFLRASVHPTPTKHVVYLVATTVLGILISLIAHAVLETIVLNWAQDVGRGITWYGGCALHPAVQIGLLVAGALGGFFLGRFWWRWVYVERRWAQGRGLPEK
ncbi:MAG: hypothetical protein V1916_03340 [Patescibacteria group bacterium]